MLAGGKERSFNLSWTILSWTIPVHGSCVHMRNFKFCAVILSTNITRNREIFKKLLRNFQEATNNLETIEKLLRNYREMGNYREMIEKFSRNGK